MDVEMATTTMAETADATRQVWQNYLATERNQRYDPVDGKFMDIFRDFLVSDSATAAQDAAKLIDKAFADGWLPQKSMLQHGDDGGLADFVHLVYNLIFELAPLLPYDTPEHERLFELLMELRRLPPRTFKLSEVGEPVHEYKPYIDDPDFFDVLHDESSNNYPNPDDSDGPEELQQQCDAWVNFSVFKAKCMEAGVLDQETNLYGFPGGELIEGLEQVIASPPERNCKVLVAAQYLIKAGRAMHEKLIVEAAGKDAATARRGVFKWQVWAIRLEQLAEKGDLEPRVVDAVKEARRKMAMLDPGLLPVNGRGA